MQHASPELDRRGREEPAEINREQIKGARLVANPGC